MKSPIMNGLQVLKSVCNIKFLNKRVPVYCEWEVTNYCNMDCPCCSTLTKDRNVAKDLSTSDALDIIDQLAEMGTKTLHFSGGEPTLRKDLPDLITRAKQNNIMVSFTTNGSAPISVMERLIHADIIRVSIDGSEDYHDKHRLYNGAYKKATATLQYLRSRNLSPLIITFYSDETSYPMLEHLCLLARDLKVKIVINIHINHDDEERTYTSWQKLGRNAKYIEALTRLKEEFPDVLVNPEPFLTVAKLGGLEIYGCRAMDVAIAIKADGSVCLPCTRFSEYQTKGRLKDIYYGPKAEEIRKLQGTDPLCEGCLMRCMTSASALLQVRGQLSLLDTYAKSFLF